MEEKQCSGKAFEAWPLASKEDRAQHPTGKYSVPKMLTIPPETVIIYFGKFGTFFIHEDKLRYFVYFDDSFRPPPQTTLYFNNTPLIRYNLREEAYWGHIERCHPAFHDLCSHYTEDELIEMRVVDSKRRLYSLPPHLFIRDLPASYLWEAFRRKIRRSKRTAMLITIMRCDYALLMLLLSQMGNGKTPLIKTSKSLDGDDNTTLQLCFHTEAACEALDMLVSHFVFLQFRLD